MKTPNYILLAMVLLLMYACKEQFTLADITPPVADMFNAEAQATINGQQTFAFAHKQYKTHYDQVRNDTFVVTLNTGIIHPRIRSWILGLGNLRFELGRHAVTPYLWDFQTLEVGADFSYNIADGDVVGGYYLPTENKDNHITLTVIDTIGSVIHVEGQFDIELRMADRYVPDPYFGRTVTVENGSFEVDLPLR